MDIADAAIRPGIAPCPTEAVIEHVERFSCLQVSDDVSLV